VLWVDEGFRTAVLGNKVGDFGWIIDRSTTGGAERITAAREILDFNGYAVQMLRTVK
jgi:apolipoprotein D and lipocalin family protein